MLSINNMDTPEINKGVEIILRGRKLKPKTFSFNFEKLVFFLKNEVTISFNFSFNIRKPQH
jgi:hypothetical protein